MQDKLHTNLSNDVLVDVANLAPHQAEVTAEKKCDDLEVGTLADPATATFSDRTPSPSAPKTRQSKRHRATAMSHKHVCCKPGVATPIRRLSRQKTDNGRVGRNQAANHASFMEWPLPNAVLKQTKVNGEITFQLQFTWATSCASHVPPAVMSMGNKDDKSNIYAVKRLLARWKTGTYLLEWADGSTSWEPRKNLINKQMIRDFEATYQGFDEGIDVLASRIQKRRQQWRVHWHGRPTREDCWVDGRLMDPTLVGRIQAFGFDEHC